MKRSTLVVAVLFSSRLAMAGDPTTPDGWYEVGQTQFTLGNFDKAVDAFKKGFEMETDDSKKPAYLYNIAQAYRQANDCRNAVFFYKRFLAMKAQDTKKPLKPELKTEVEEHIKDGEECIKKEDDTRNRPPDHTIPPDDGHKPDDTHKTDTTPPTDPNKKVAVVDDPNKHVDEPPEVHKTGDGTPRLVEATLVGGGAKINAGNLSIPIRATGTLTAGYPLPINDKLHLVLGAGFTFTPVGFENTITNESKTANLIAVLANGGAEYTVAPKIAVRGDLGVGVLVFSGIEDMGNPFTQDGAPTSGALTMLNIRAAVSGSYEITPNIVGTITPFAFSYSPAKAGLRDDIKSITAIDFMIGVGYRM